MGACESNENELNIQKEAWSESGFSCESHDRNIPFNKALSTNNYVLNEKNVEILRIDLLEKGQKIKQFEDMANNQHYLNNSQIEGASPNFYT